MRRDVLSRRYARALADVVAPLGRLETVRQELTALAGRLAASGALEALGPASRLSRERKKELVRRIASELGASEHTARFLEYLVQKRRLGLLPDIARSYSREADERLGIRRAVLKTAIPLSDEQVRRLADKLSRLTGATVRLDSQVDESLIGGFEVHMDGQLFDGSLRGRLEHIRETIAHGG